MFTLNTNGLGFKITGFISFFYRLGSATSSFIFCFAIFCVCAFGLEFYRLKQFPANDLTLFGLVGFAFWNAFRVLFLDFSIKLRFSSSLLCI
jgi:hypothetical protein